MGRKSELFFLETERLLLRPWNNSDFSLFCRLAKNPKILKYISDGKPWADKKIRSFMQTQQQHYRKQGYCRWAVESLETHQFVGICGVGAFDPPGFLEIGWWIDVPFWGKGFATEAAKCSLDHATNQMGITHLKSVSHPENKGSVAVMRKLGFREESFGVLGDYHRTPAKTPIVTYSFDQLKK